MRTASAARIVVAGTALTAWAISPVGAQKATRIPLREGLRIVTALNLPDQGDSESIKTLIRTTDTEVQFKYSWEAVVTKDEGNPLAALLGRGNQPKQTSAPGKEASHVNVTRTVARQDLKSSHEYRQHFGNSAPERYPGSTAVGLSASVLNELKTKGQSQLSVDAGGIIGAVGNMMSGLLGANSTKELDKSTRLAGMLKRIEAAPVPFKVLVNDQSVELPAIHASGQLGEEDAEFWILDDPENPLSLKWTIGEEKLQVIKLSFPADVTAPAAPGTAAAGRIERELEEDGRSAVYGIYFDFASDRIKEESEPVLKEIAAVMTKYPAWTLTVEGHTDNVGTTADNQDLSLRRAAAVRKALGDTYSIPANRLVPAGFGESRPKDTNDTLEGRARNRRVELARIAKKQAERLP
jgi:outer membrane protein OmpA-like peptidoglycan-associated protein